jgi:hypothetical protein
MASKQLERVYLDGFLKSFPHLHVIADCEAPDFILRDAAGPIGLEVVQTFRDSSRAGSKTKEIESRRQATISDLSQRYYDSGGKPILVTALMSGASLGDLDRLANTLQRWRPSKLWLQRRLRLSRTGATLYVTALPREAGRYQRWRCASNSAGWVRQADDLVSAAIAKKAAKLSVYRKAVDRIALLVVADATRTSGMLRPSGDLRVPNQGFEAIYFYRHPEAAVQLA